MKGQIKRFFRFEKSKVKYYFFRFSFFVFGRGRKKRIFFVFVSAPKNPENDTIFTTISRKKVIVFRFCEKNRHFRILFLFYFFRFSFFVFGRARKKRKLFARSENFLFFVSEKKFAISIFRLKKRKR